MADASAVDGEPQWFWCLDHKAVEGPGGCPPDRRLGPFPTRAAAASWKETFDARNRAWDEEDEAADAPATGERPT